MVSYGEHHARGEREGAVIYTNLRHFVIECQNLLLFCSSCRDEGVHLRLGPGACNWKRPYAIARLGRRLCSMVLV